MHTKTIASIASGMGGGIGVIRISGDDAMTIAGKIFRKRSQIDLSSECEKEDVQSDDKFFEKTDTHTIHYGFIVDEGKVVDEVMVLVMKKPNSYTREDVIEIDSHGGPFIVKKILETVLKNGAALAEPGEFTKRAFFNGRIDLAQAEAVMKLISSENNYALDSALSQLEGNLSKYIEDIRQDILYDMGYIEAALDDPEHYDLGKFRFELRDKLERDKDKLNELVEHFDDGRMKSEGINTVIVGKPNAGKSSLMNLLLDEERAIVTNVAGTTRDILEERVKLGDVILNLVDTAGIHETDDVVENIGVNKAIEYADKCDFIIYVVDSSEKLDDADFQIIDILQQKKGVILMNKSDLNPVTTVFYCSICLPRKPAADRASFCSTSPILLFPSFSNRITLPMMSPSQMIGTITSATTPSISSPATGINSLVSFSATTASRSWITCSSCLLIIFCSMSRFGPPETAITWSRSVMQTSMPVDCAMDSAY